MQSFLSTEENYRTVQALELKNLVVPVSGDFAGPHALRTPGQAPLCPIAAFLRANVAGRVQSNISALECVH